MYVVVTWDTVMQVGLLLYTLGLWAVLVVFAIVNGVFRQSVLLPRLGQTIGRALSSIILSVLILTVSYVFLMCTDVAGSDADLWFMGVVWLSLTVLFEFGFGHFLMKRSWSALLEDYDVFKGRIWVLVLIVTLMAPYLMGQLV